MTSDLFGDLVSWWVASQPEVDNSIQHNEYQALTEAFKTLGIMTEQEVVEKAAVVCKWHQDTDNTFLSVGEIDLASDDGVRTVSIAGYAVTSPPPMPITERIKLWEATIVSLRNSGAEIPRWYLIWSGAIFTDYPPYAFTDYLEDFDLSESELEDFSVSLKATLHALSQERLLPLGLLSSLRTDGLRIFYCGFGFDLGGRTRATPDELLRTLEEEILPTLPVGLIAHYGRGE